MLATIESIAVRVKPTMIQPQLIRKITVAVPHAIATLMIFCSLTAFAHSEKPSLKDRFADFEGVKIHYLTVGKGSEALILIHGWTCSAAFWRQSISEFPEYRVIAIDLPGHGQSEKPRIDYTIEYFARSVEAVMRDAGLKRAVLIGHSMGTPVAVQFYRLFPNRTLGLVFVDGPLRVATREETEQVIRPLRENYHENIAKLVDGMLQSIRDEQLKQEIRSTMLSTPDYVGLSAIESVTDERFSPKGTIDVPVLAIMAESAWWKPDTEIYYRSIARNLDFQMWKGVSHFLMMERPADFNKAVKRFVVENKLL